MKKIMILLAAIALIFSFSLVSCENGWSTPGVDSNRLGGEGMWGWDLEDWFDDPHASALSVTL
jgi:hypothetical protein